ncbi:glycoside hydrolase superfamily [Coniochaeta sp. 2T2.1]|nr:glycoside hydrolase superfamily [Coniochaeta sp. 2T2.1]
MSTLRNLLAVALTSAVAHTAVEALVSPDGVGKLPALGWNSWNEFHCDINATVFETIAQRMVDLGLKDAGYVYVNIDDCWSDKDVRRDPATNAILPNATRFPDGISGLAEKVHGLGLKLGIYSDAGTSTCAGYAGSLGYEAIDAATFAEWGVDYLKYDNCNVPANWSDEYTYNKDDGTSNAPPGYSWDTSNSAKRYHAMRDELLKQNRTIEFSMCIWGEANVQSWGNTTGHSWRMYGDINPSWSGADGGGTWGVMPILNHASFFWNATDLWGHGDWDMLEVGIGDLTYEESRSHFALWAALRSPLIIGTPLAEVSDDIVEILLNKELLAYNQDPVYGASAMPYKWGLNPDGTSNLTHPAAYWTGPSGEGIHVFMVNTEDREVTMSAVFGEIPGLKGVGNEFLVHDMWTGQDLGNFTDKVDVKLKVHDTAALRITGVDGSHPNPTWTTR